MPARGQRGRRGRCTCRRQADWEWQRHAPKQDEALAGAAGAVLGVPGRAMRGWGRWWRHYLMLIERKCGVLSHTINEVEGETAAAAKYQKQKQNRKTKRKRKRKELKWRVKRRDETTKHKFFDDSFAARHAKKLPLPVSLFTLPPLPPSLSLSITLHLPVFYHNSLFLRHKCQSFLLLQLLLFGSNRSCSLHLFKPGKIQVREMRKLKYAAGKLLFNEHLFASLLSETSS